MRKIFVRTLVVTAVLQFIATRRRAGHVIEEGRAEQLWMMYPANVVVNALLWTLLFSGIGRVVSLFRRP